MATSKLTSQVMTLARGLSSLLAEIRKAGDEIDEQLKTLTPDRVAKLALRLVGKLSPEHRAAVGLYIQELDGKMISHGGRAVTRAIIEYRQAVASDVQFIIKTWIDSYKGSHGAGILSISEFTVPCSCGKPIRYDFAAVMELTLAQLLQRPGLTTWVAHNPRERPPHDLYGYLVSETEANVPSYVRDARGEMVLKVESSKEPLVHFVFVKRLYREMGIARALFHRAGIDPRAPYLYSCKTANVSKLEKAGVMPQARWFPLSARFTKREKTT